MLYRQGIMGNFWWQYRLPGHERLTGKPSSWCLAVIALINTAFNFGVAESIFCTVSLKLNNCPNSTSSRRFRPHQCKLHLSSSSPVPAQARRILSCFCSVQACCICYYHFGQYGCFGKHNSDRLWLLVSCTLVYTITYLFTITRNLTLPDRAPVLEV